MNPADYARAVAQLRAAWAAGDEAGMQRQLRTLQEQCDPPQWEAVTQVMDRLLADAAARGDDRRPLDG